MDRLFVENDHVCAKILESHFNNHMTSFTTFEQRNINGGAMELHHYGNLVTMIA